MERRIRRRDNNVPSPSEHPRWRRRLNQLVRTSRPPRATIRSTGICVAVLFLAMGAYGLKASLDLQLYISDQGPGPGFFPLGVSALLVLTSAIWLVSLGRWTGEVTRFFSSRAAQGRALLLIAAIIAYAVLLSAFGYMIATFLFMLAIFRALGRLRWIFTLLLALASCVALDYGFVHLLDVQLPVGTVGLFNAPGM